MKKKPSEKETMKNKSLILATVIIAVNCNILSAQTSKGKFLIGELSYIELMGNGVTGSMNVGYTTFQTKSDGDNNGDSSKDKQFSMNLIPRAGYFVIDNLAIGLDVFLATEFNKAMDDAYKSTTTFFAVGPFVRYYIPTKKVLPFAEVNYSMGSRLYKSEYNGSESSYSAGIKLYGVGLGLAIPIGEKVSFDAIAGYHAYVNKEKEDNENNERLVAGTIGLKLGFTVFLGSKKQKS